MCHATSSWPVSLRIEDANFGACDLDGTPNRVFQAVARAEAEADKSGLNGDPGWDVLRM